MEAGSKHVCHVFNLNRKIVIKCSRYTKKSTTLCLTNMLLVAAQLCNRLSLAGGAFSGLQSTPVAGDAGFLRHMWPIPKPKTLFSGPHPAAGNSFSQSDIL